MTCPLRVGGAVAVGLRSCWPTRCRCARTGCEPRESNGIRLLRSLALWAAVVIVEGRLATSRPRARPRSSARRSDSAIRAVPTPLPRCSGRTWRWQISTASGCATRPSAPTNPVHRITAEPRGSPSRHATRQSEEPCAAFDACASWTPPGTGHFSVRTVRSAAVQGGCPSGQYGHSQDVVGAARDPRRSPRHSRTVRSAIQRDLDRHGDGQRSHGEVHDPRRCIARRPCRNHRAASRAFPKTPRRRVLHDARWIRHPNGRRSTLCG